MKQLVHLPLPHEGYFSQIVDAKKDAVKKQPNLAKQCLNGLKLDIAQHYAHYLAKFNADDLVAINASTYVDFEKRSLISAYENEGAVLAGLKAFIKALQPTDLQGTCPYCGISTPESFDHYLPKEDFPEYAVLALNLIPCCIACNGKKGTYWRENAQRKIINFYRDDLPSETFLFAKASMVRNVVVPKFSIKNNGAIDHRLFAIIEGHFARLNLLSRYKKESNDEITNVVESVTSHCRSTDLDIIREGLGRNVDSIARRMGPNYWKVALMRALSECDDFIQYLSGKIVP